MDSELSERGGENFIHQNRRSEGGGSWSSKDFGGQQDSIGGPESLVHCDYRDSQPGHFSISGVLQEPIGVRAAQRATVGKSHPKSRKQKQAGQAGVAALWLNACCLVLLLVIGFLVQQARKEADSTKQVLRMISEELHVVNGKQNMFASVETSWRSASGNVKVTTLQGPDETPEAWAQRHANAVAAMKQVFPEV